VAQLSQKSRKITNVPVAQQQIIHMRKGDRTLLSSDVVLVSLIKTRSAKSKATQSKRSSRRLEKEKEYTPEQIMRKLKELLALRGKRGTNREQMISDLELLSRKANDPIAIIKIKVQLITAYLEINLNKGVYMGIPVWKKCATNLGQILEHLTAHENIRLSEDEDVEEQFSDDEEEDDGVSRLIAGALDARRLAQTRAREAREAEESKDTGVTYILGNFYSFLYRLHVEYTRSLQGIDHTSSLYIDRLRDLPIITTLCKRAADYYKSIDKTMLLCQCKLIHLELIYYYTDRVFKCERKGGAPPSTIRSSPVIDLAMYLYAHGDARQKTKALLMHITYLAIHNYFEQARDLLLMSHIMENINDADINSRILFNRGMAQLGLCAFRTGFYTQALNCLADLQSSKAIKELLGQGSSRHYNDRDLKQERLEKKRQYPYHMHLNLDLLESTHLLGGMFAEVHNIATGKRKQVSKQFRRLYAQHAANDFNAPPENSRDLIMAATSALCKGNWEKALGHILALRMWRVIPGVEEVKLHLTQAVKETALTLFLVVYGSSYRSISIPTLTTRFGLDQRTVVRLTSRMMVLGDLQGVWDQPSGTLIMHTTQPTRLQTAALEYADKVVLFTEQNEQLLGIQHHGRKHHGGGGHSKQGDRNRKTKSYNDNRTYRQR
jgi:hypothetical protein